MRRVSKKRNSIPRLAKIKTGIPGEKFPKSVDYFICRGKNGVRNEISEQFEAMFGEKPKLIPIQFITKEAADNFFELRDGKGNVMAEAAGESVKVRDPKKGWVTHVFQTDEEIEEYKGQLEKLAFETYTAKGKKSFKGWRERLTLDFMISGFPLFGVFRYETTASASTIPQILTVYDQVKEAAGGSLSGIRFLLSVEFHSGNAPNGSPTRYPVVSLLPEVQVDTMLKIGELAADERQRLTGGGLKALGSGDIEEVEAEELSPLEQVFSNPAEVDLKEAIRELKRLDPENEAEVAEARRTVGDDAAQLVTAMFAECKNEKALHAVDSIVGPLFAEVIEDYAEIFEKFLKEGNSNVK